MTATVIIPYLHEEEVSNLRDKLYNIPCIIERDDNGIGSDLMFEKLWNKCDTDIIILHSDMSPLEKDTDNKWYFDLCELAKQDTFKNAGMLGCKLLYPAKDDNNNYYIQSAGGKFTNGRPDHFGSGIDISTQKTFKEPEADIGQYNNYRKVAWTTFGGVYIRRGVISQVGNFNRRYSWTYNRDVDYCLRARQLGWDIVQTPISLIHFESRDNRQLMNINPKFNHYWAHNLKTLQSLWMDSPFYHSIDEVIYE